jgi:hypothetical protein
MPAQTMEEWHASRAEFITLTGPTPVLPDFAFGTWFTWWHPYTEVEAKSEVERWETDKLPIDVWALDMNWRVHYSLPLPLTLTLTLSLPLINCNPNTE